MKPEHDSGNVIIQSCEIRRPRVTFDELSRYWSHPMSRPPGRAKLIIALALAAVVSSLMTVFFWDYTRPYAFARRASGVQIGDSKEEVRRVMGRPVSKIVYGSGNGFIVSEDFDSREECWVHGPVFDFENAFSSEPPFFYPFRFRFAPIRTTFTSNSARRTRL